MPDFYHNADPDMDADADADRSKSPIILLKKWW